MVGQSEPVVEEQRHRRDRYAKVVSRPTSASTDSGGDQLSRGQPLQRCRS